MTIYPGQMLIARQNMLTWQHVRFKGNVNNKCVSMNDCVLVINAWMEYKQVRIVCLHKNDIVLVSCHRRNIIKNWLLF
jgi:hypothetical protein